MFKKFLKLASYTEISNLTSICTIFPSKQFPGAVTYFSNVCKALWSISGNFSTTSLELANQEKSISDFVQGTWQMLQSHHISFHLFLGLTRYFKTIKGKCAGVMSYRTNQLLHAHVSKNFILTKSLKWWRISIQNFFAYSTPFWNKFLVDKPWALKKTSNITLPLLLFSLNFCLQGDDLNFYSHGWCLSCGSYKNHKVSSPVLHCSRKQHLDQAQ
jgi:hypothetical protein